MYVFVLLSTMVCNYVHIYFVLILEVVRKSGSICKCYDDFCEDIQISDELRKVPMCYCGLHVFTRDNLCMYICEPMCLT